jgi:hypothetical protein
MKGQRKEVKIKGKSWDFMGIPAGTLNTATLA